MPVAIDVGQRVLVYNPSHGWTMAYFVRAQQANDNKLQILVIEIRLSQFHFDSFFFSLDMSPIELPSQTDLPGSLSLSTGTCGIE